MDRQLIRFWNEEVDPKDLVFVLGDFSFYNREKTAQIISQLNGHKVLIKGNHDRSCNSMIELGFDEAYKELEYDGWRLSHYPIYDGVKTLCGHVHDQWKVDQNNVNVGCDVWGFRPRTLEEVLKNV